MIGFVSCGDEATAGFEPSFGSSSIVAGDSSGSTGLSLHTNNSDSDLYGLTL